MSPPLLAALAFLAAWMLVMFWATTTAAAGQARADDRLDSIAPDDRLEQGDASETGFAAADD